MNISEQEALVLSRIMKWYLESHPKCPASKSDLLNIKSALSKANDYLNFLRLKHFLSMEGKHVNHM